jgi:DNA-binding transcriptional LysR family regulator
VRIIEPPAEDLMHVEPLFQDPHVVVAGAHNPIARRCRLGLAELMEKPWALPLPDQPYGTVLYEAFRAHGLRVPPVIVGSTLPLRTALLMTGRFLSTVPQVVMRFSETTGDRDLEEQNTQAARPTVCRAYPGRGAAARPSMSLIRE